MDNSEKKMKSASVRQRFEKNFPGIKSDINGISSIHYNDILDYIDREYGKYLHALFLKEWELSNSRDQLAKFEEEHSDSLALIMENESQKIQLEEFNNQLNDLFEMHSKDMKMAASVQRNLLFEKSPEVKNFDIAFHYQPCSSVSGDFYDFYHNRDNNELTGIVLADVSGHGIASSLLTILAKPIFFREFNSSEDLPVNDLLDKINSRLIEQMSASENYLTAVLLRFKDNNVEYSNSAHPDIFLHRNSDNTVSKVIPPEGPIQGSLLGIRAVALPFASYNFKMEQGDSLLIYTDCLTESQNKAGDEFGENGIISVLSESKGLDATSILQNLLLNFRNFTAEKPLKDDLSIIVLKKL